MKTDPDYNLSPRQWADKQIEYNLTSIPSVVGILDIIKSFSGNLIGCEIGVCLGNSTEYLLRNVYNIEKLYAVDNYPELIDWNGTNLSRERQDLLKKYARDKLLKYDNVELIYESSTEFSRKLYQESLDFVFIDGDHSFNGVYLDFVNYFPLVKRGGIFSGHDINLNEIRTALQKFLGERFNDIVTVGNNGWYLIK